TRASRPSPSRADSSRSSSAHGAPPCVQARHWSRRPARSRAGATWARARRCCSGSCATRGAPSRSRASTRSRWVRPGLASGGVAGNRRERWSWRLGAPAERAYLQVMADDLTRALERRTVRTRQVVIATAAAVLAVAARHASPDLEVTAVAAVAAVATFAVALAVAHRDVRVRSIDPAAVASKRQVRVVAGSLEHLARLAERGAREPRQIRPPLCV